MSPKSSIPVDTGRTFLSNTGSATTMASLRAVALWVESDRPAHSNVPLHNTIVIEIALSSIVAGCCKL